MAIASQSPRNKRERARGYSRSPLWLASVPVLALASFLFLPRVADNSRLSFAFIEATGVLAVFLLIVVREAHRASRNLQYQFVPRKVHYVQMMVHSCIYAYWGWYWREVYHYVPLLVAQIIFAYSLDMLLCWMRRDTWILGFGPIPIILSTNLFIWFRDDYFSLQFLMVATIFFGKEFLKWKREGRRVHIFNPSSFGLAIFSFVLLATHSTDITRGVEIANTITLPPHIYLELFLLGLVVQSLFRVTLVTVSAALSLVVLDFLYLWGTGTYFFIDSNIPVAVFLGLHLLVTDPATSPSKGFGKVVFGALYGASVFGLFWALNRMGAPEFYDKLLCVPFLNLAVRYLDRVSAMVCSFATELRFPLPNWNSRQWNLVSMSIWVLCFGALQAQGFWTKNGEHPGGKTAFWRMACEENRYNSCRTWERTLKLTCQADNAADCLALGRLVNGGQRVEREPIVAGQSFSHACDLGLQEACADLRSFIAAGGVNAFSASCGQRDGTSCFILGSLYSSGNDLPRNDVLAFSLFQQACDAQLWRGCARLGLSYLVGQGTAPDRQRALENFDKGCRGGNAASCIEAAKVYYTLRDRARVGERLKQACGLGMQEACPKDRL